MGEIEGGGEFWGGIARGGGWKNFGRGERELEGRKSDPTRATSARRMDFLIGRGLAEGIARQRY